MKPTDDTIALVGFLLISRYYVEPWFYADELRHALKRLGFAMPSSQWISARLTAMTKESSPRFERREGWDGIYRYRVTSWAANGLSNVWPGFIAPDCDLPMPFPDHHQEGEGQS